MALCYPPPSLNFSLEGERRGGGPSILELEYELGKQFYVHN